MVKVRVAICDDEKEIRESMERKIKVLYPEMEITQFESGQAFLQQASLFDMILLDIHMEGLNGMEVARKIRKEGNRAILIFVTALEEYVFQAFDVGAFHYLVKPVDPVKLLEVIQRALKEQKERKKIKMDEEKSISIKIGAVTEKIYLSEIQYIEVFNRKCILHKLDGTLEFYGKLTDLEKGLGEEFVRSHRSYLVNLRYVLKYDATSITLENGATVAMAKQKYAEFVKCYMRYAQKIGNVEE